MKRLKLLFLVMAAVGAGILASSVNAQSGSGAALAVQTFSVEKMTCAACPITVRAAMQGVEGVHTVEVELESRTATVTFDPGVTTIEEIAGASAHAGYPARAVPG